MDGWDDAIAEYQALLNALHRTQGFGLMFVECAPAMAATLSQQISRDCPHRPVLRVDLPAAVQGEGLTRAIAQVWPGASVGPVILLRGLEAALADCPYPGAIPPVLISFNQRREVLRDRFPGCFVVFGNVPAMDQVMRYAPDFFDWRSGWFRFSEGEG